MEVGLLDLWKPVSSDVSDVLDSVQTLRGCPLSAEQVFEVEQLGFLDGPRSWSCSGRFEGGVYATSLLEYRIEDLITPRSMKLTAFHSDVGPPIVYTSP